MYFALPGEASTPGSNGHAKLVTVQIKRVGGFKHSKTHGAHFHHSKLPELGQSSAPAQEDPAPLGKPCLSRRKWAEPLVASHLLRCLSTLTSLRRDPEVRVWRGGGWVRVPRRGSAAFLRDPGVSAGTACVRKPLGDGGRSKLLPLLASPGLFTEPWAAGAGSRRVSELS